MTSTYSVSTDIHDIGGGYVAFTAHVTDEPNGNTIYSTGRRESEQAAEQQAQGHISWLAAATP